MLGAILGDIIGSRFEFDIGGKTKEFELFHEDCEFTDDTVITVAVFDGLNNAGINADEETIKTEVIKAMKKWGRLYPRAGYGGMFYQWLRLKNTAPYNSYGNGSAMRVSSVGWLYDSLAKTRAVARLTAEVTHNHPEGIKGAECTASVIYLAREGKTKFDIRDYVTKEFGYDVSESLDSMRKRHKHDETCQDSLPKALVSFFEGNSYEDVVRNAVSLGGDTDTLAAIAGSMAEAMYGIPSEIKEQGMVFLTEKIKERINMFEMIKL